MVHHPSVIRLRDHGEIQDQQQPAAKIEKLCSVLKLCITVL